VRAHAKYLRYLLRHKWYVLRAGLKTGAPLWRLIVHDASKFRPREWRPYVRKFYTQPQPGERVSGVADNAGFSGVVLKTRQSHHPFSGKPLPGKVDCLIRPDDGGHTWWAWHNEVDREEVDAGFDRAWLHHQHANPHHWQHWVLREDGGAIKVLPMPYLLVCEMVADWAGAGRAITGRWEVAEWYVKNRDKMQMHPNTRLHVEGIIAAHFAPAPAPTPEVA
jgi:hypothetical protein